ncbi:MAG: hypothetical protein RJA10_2500 [Pseudomonadota bacterium]|jgi:hypothetical protein
MSQANGQPLALSLQATLVPLLAARWPAGHAPEATLADPWFANLYLFRDAHAWRWHPGEWPCITGHAYDGARLLLPLFDLGLAPLDAVQQLMQGHAAFGPLSAAQAARLDPLRWAFTHCRADADYLYPADNFRHYRGRLLQKKRNLAKQLLDEHSVQALPYQPAMAAEAEGVLRGWMDDKAKQPGDTDDGPCREALALADRLGLEGTLYRIDGRAAGFLLAEPIRPGVMVMRFSKGLDAYKGLYQHMFQQFCRARPALRWLNFEQDLGLPNFRQTKQSYNPSALLDKFRARLR